ncbi:MAG: hypothetical protein U1D00_12395 [Mycobacterium sp.]|nr:hypothetical protein [Mycobacterium sp.]
MSRARWLLLGLFLVTLCGVVLAVVLWRDDSSSGVSESDCSVVAGLVRDFRAMDGQDQTAGHASAQFADRVRTATESVSDRQLRVDLEKWAEGFSQLADIQRGHAGGAAPNPDDDADVMRAGDAIYGTADALRHRCPDAWSIDGH